MDSIRRRGLTDGCIVTSVLEASLRETYSLNGARYIWSPAVVLLAEYYICKLPLEGGTGCSPAEATNKQELTTGALAGSLKYTSVDEITFLVYSE